MVLHVTTKAEHHDNDANSQEQATDKDKDKDVAPEDQGDTKEKEDKEQSSRKPPTRRQGRSAKDKRRVTFEEPEAGASPRPPRKGCLRKPAAADGSSIADNVMLQQRTARDEKRRQQMQFDRSLVPAKRASAEHNSFKCPADMLPTNNLERAQLWEVWKETMGNYDKIKAVMTKTKTRNRKGARGRVWVFVKDVKDQICNGHAKRAEGMIKRLQARHGYHRIHPDMSDEEEGAQVHCLERDAAQSENESESEVEFRAEGQLDGPAEKQDDFTKSLAPGRATVTPKSKTALK